MWKSFDDKPDENVPIIIKTKTNQYALCQYELGSRVDKTTYDWLNGHNFGGYEWDWDFDISDITHWIYLSDLLSLIPENNVDVFMASNVTLTPDDIKKLKLMGKISTKPVRG